MTNSTGRARSSRTARLIGVVAAVLLVVVVAAWLVLRPAENDSLVSNAAEPGVSHVHGLGIDPTDGALYVATHNGMFRIPDGGTAKRVGGSYQDTMGFTVKGPGNFLGSGHPDMAGIRAGQPRRLGLIESSDGAHSWASLSLAGEVDFHSLAYAHDRVYGWDATSGRFMVSVDRQTWDTRSTLQMHTFAVDPTNADHLIAATAAGLRTSFDGGRTWATASSPGLVVLAWAPSGVLWGAESSGAMRRSDDRGLSWQASGQLRGQPQALSATKDTLWAAAGNQDSRTGIYLSTDGGSTWMLRYRDPA